MIHHLLLKIGVLYFPVHVVSQSIGIAAAPKFNNQTSGLGGFPAKPASSNNNNKSNTSSTSTRASTARAASAATTASAAAAASGPSRVSAITSYDAPSGDDNTWDDDKELDDLIGDD